MIKYSDCSNESFSKSRFFLLDLLLIKPAVSINSNVWFLYWISQFTESRVVWRLGEILDRDTFVSLLKSVDLPVFSLPKIDIVF